MKIPTKKELKKMSNRDIQEYEHDTLVDACEDLSGSLHTHKVYEKFKNERIRRNLKPLRNLNPCP